MFFFPLLIKWQNDQTLTSCNFTSLNPSPAIVSNLKYTPSLFTKSTSLPSISLCHCQISEQIMSRGEVEGVRWSLLSTQVCVWNCSTTVLLILNDNVIFCVIFQRREFASHRKWKTLINTYYLTLWKLKIDTAKGIRPHATGLYTIQTSLE